MLLNVKSKHSFPFNSPVITFWLVTILKSPNLVIQPSLDLLIGSIIVGQARNISITFIYWLTIIAYYNYYLVSKFIWLNFSYTVPAKSSLEYLNLEKRLIIETI